MVRITCPPFSFCEKGSVNITPVPVNNRTTVESTVQPKDRPISELLNFDNAKKKGEVGKKKKSYIIAATNEVADKDVADINYEIFEKDARSYRRIENALNSNDFLRNLLDADRMKAVIEAMVLEEYSADSFIIREGETGSHLYVSDFGTFEVIKEGKVVKVFGSGEAFGELALLYKAKRFASIKVSTNSRIWSIERKTFQAIVVRSGKQEQQDNVRFLASVPLLKGIPYRNLNKIADFLQKKYFHPDTAIVKQGEKGDKFYIIRGGTVVVTQTSADGKIENVVAELGRGDYFGEQALLREDRRLATVTAKAPGVECLILSRKPFNEFLGNIDELKKVFPKPAGENKKFSGAREYDHIEFWDLEYIGTMGEGAFGRVELVEYKKGNATFALKKLKKRDIVHLEHQEHVYNEKNMMLQCRSPFICKLYKTYRDTKYVYLLMEPLLGGDVWTILHKKKLFDEKTSRFIVACVVEAFEHLHDLDIIYRDLKPENLMLDSKGYIKLVDFGYAKSLTTNIKTYTFAGTPDYLAPEIILGNGHDRAVDCWSLGILVHELLAGKPPFKGVNQVRTYNLILRGIDAVTFNPKISKSAQLLIKKLCRPLPTERLGYLKGGIKDIKHHKWFVDFDWQKLKQRKMPAPIVRPVKHDKDLSNFDRCEPEKVPKDETSGWDADF